MLETPKTQAELEELLNIERGTDVDQCIKSHQLLFLTWMHNKGIGDAPPITQIGKLLGEVGELLVAIETGDEKKIFEELGDVLVCALNTATTLNMVAGDALDFAYDKIKERKGKVVDGVFVKD